MRPYTFLAVIALGLPTLPAQADPFGEADIAEIIDISRSNAARFERDFEGKPFSGSFNFESIERMLLSDTMSVSFGDDSFLPVVQCMEVDETTVDYVIDLNKSTSIWVNGKIQTTWLGIVRLTECHLM